MSTSREVGEATRKHGLSLAARWTLLVLLEDWGDGDAAWVTKSEIAHAAWLTEYQVGQALRELEEKGLVEIHRPGGPGGKARAYRLVNSQRGHRPDYAAQPAEFKDGQTAAVGLKQGHTRSDQHIDGERALDEGDPPASHYGGLPDGKLAAVVRDLAGVVPTDADVAWLEQVVIVARNTGVFTGRLLGVVGGDTPLRRSRDREPWRRVKRALTSQDEDLLESLDMEVEPGESPRSVVQRLPDWSPYRVCGLLLVLDHLFEVNQDATPRD